MDQPRAAQTASRLWWVLALSAAAVSGLAAWSLIAVGALYGAGLRDHCAALVSWLLDHPELLLALMPLTLLVTLLGGVLVTMVRQIRSTRRLLARLGPTQAPPRRLRAAAAAAGLEAQVDWVPSPMPLVFCHGLLRPRVLVSAGVLRALDDEELLAVLRHEDHHRRARDPLRLATIRHVETWARFWPAARDLATAWRYWSEVAADEAVQPRSRLALANAMVKLLREQQGWEHAPEGACALSPVLGRVALLLDLAPPRRPAMRRSLTKAGIGLLVAVALMLAPVAAAVRPHPHQLQVLHPCPASVRTAVEIVH